MSDVWDFCKHLVPMQYSCCVHCTSELGSRNSELCNLRPPQIWAQQNRRQHECLHESFCFICSVGQKDLLYILTLISYLPIKNHYCIYRVICWTSCCLHTDCFKEGVSKNSFINREMTVYSVSSHIETELRLEERCLNIRVGIPSWGGIFFDFFRGRKFRIPCASWMQHQLLLR